MWESSVSISQYFGKSWDGCETVISLIVWVFLNIWKPGLAKHVHVFITRAYFNIASGFDIKHELYSLGLSLVLSPFYLGINTMRDLKVNLASPYRKLKVNLRLNNTVITSQSSQSVRHLWNFSLLSLSPNSSNSWKRGCSNLRLWRESCVYQQCVAIFKVDYVHFLRARRFFLSLCMEFERNSQLFNPS